MERNALRRGLIVVVEQPYQKVAACLSWFMNLLPCLTFAILLDGTNRQRYYQKKNALLLDFTGLLSRKQSSVLI